MKLPADLPRRPAEEAVRRYALLQLERAEAAREALVAGDRDEALHDFRVALRRLRSVLRLHRDALAADYPAKPLKRLGKLARDTNPGRDAEVQLAWLLTLGETMKPHERTGYRQLVAQLEERRDASYRKVEREIARDFAGFAESLRARLGSYQVAVTLAENAHPASFADATYQALAAQRGELTQRLASIGGPTDEETAHAARIAAKRLRYLIEPLAPWAPAILDAVELLKELQDLLGELRDGQLLAAQVAAALAELEARKARSAVEELLAGTPATRPRPRRERSGLLAVARRLGERRSTLFARLADDWLGELAEQREDLARTLDAVAGELAGPFRAPRRAVASSPTT